MSILGNEIDTYEHFLYLDDMASKIKKSNSLAQKEKFMNDAYAFAKEISPQYFDEYRLLANYKFIKHGILSCEDAMPIDFIMDSTPDFNREQNAIIPVNGTIEDKLDYIVFMARKYLDKEVRKRTRGTVEFEHADLTDYCKCASDRINDLCLKLGLRFRQVLINPGFTEYPALYDGSGYHYINMVIVDDKKYIIDTTYRQFFTTTYNNLNRLGIVEISNCRPGVFMMMTPERKKLAAEILKKGWFEATPTNMMYYFDGFAISYRNGLYYQETNDYSYTTGYSHEDYMNFINGVDNQVNYKREELLGLQRTLTPKK